MKKHEILKYAYDNYPKGTKFRNKATGKIVISSGNFTMRDFWIFDTKNSDILYSWGQSTNIEWVEIITDHIDMAQKIAVRVENEVEFKALMKYYESKGWKWCSGNKPFDYLPIGGRTSVKCIPFHDSFDNGIEDCKIRDGYTIVNFPDFAKEHNIRIPLLTSEDRVDLYEGDVYYLVTNFKGVAKYEGDYLLTDNRSLVCQKECSTHFAFSTKQAALDWIAEQNKPKEIYIAIKSSYPVCVKSDEIVVECISLNHKDNIVIPAKELEEIWEAYQLLSNG